MSHYGTPDTRHGESMVPKVTYLCKTPQIGGLFRIHDLGAAALRNASSGVDHIYPVILLVSPALELCLVDDSGEVS